MTILPSFEPVSHQLVDHLQRRVLHLLLSPEMLKRELQRERARTDRNGDSFCLVLFHLDLGRLGKRTLARLAFLIARRMRVSDTAGWYGDNAVAVILPATGEAGAERFASDILVVAAKKGVYPTVSVHSYGSGTPSSGDGMGESSRVAVPLPGGPKPHFRAEPLDLKKATQGVYQIGKVVQLLARPLPLTKRVSDIVVSSLGLVLASPVLLAAAIAVKFTSRGPIFFRQRRAGLGGRSFVMFKFRSMYVDAEKRKESLRHLNEQDGPAFKIRNDPRVTSVGRFLRATSIDELPQLFNVLKGEMSLVGPRPPTFDEVGQYHAWQRRRLEVTPGLTCIWQVRGRSRVSFDEWMRMDIQYIERFTYFLDLKLILETIPAVLFRRGAS